MLIPVASSGQNIVPDGGGSITDFFGYYAMDIEGWAEDPSWTPPSDGGTVTTFLNNGSDSDFSLLGTGAAIVYRASVAALNSKPAIQYATGSKVLYLVDTSTTIKTQPITYVFVVNDTGSSGATVLADGRNGTAFRNDLFTTNVTDLTMFAGSAVETVGSWVSGPAIYVAVFDGASSKTRVNGTQTVASSSPGANSLDGFTTGADYNDSAATFDGHFAYVAVYDGDLTADGDFSAWEQGIADHYNIAT